MLDVGVAARDRLPIERDLDQPVFAWRNCARTSAAQFLVDASSGFGIDADCDGAAMRLQALRARQRHGGRCEALKRRPAISFKIDVRFISRARPDPRRTARCAPSAARGWSPRHSRRSPPACVAPRKIAPALRIAPTAPRRPAWRSPGARRRCDRRAPALRRAIAAG